LYLHRLPEQEWIGFEVVNHHATEGVAIGECFLYDQKGPIGTSTVAGVGAAQADGVMAAVRVVRNPSFRRAIAYGIFNESSPANAGTHTARTLVFCTGAKGLFFTF